MAGAVRLFEKIDGLLVQVAPEQASAAREGRTVSRMVAEIDVLWTADEEAEREVEQRNAIQRAEAQRKAAEAATAERAERRAAAEAKLTGLGLTMEDLEALRA